MLKNSKKEELQKMTEEELKDIFREVAYLKRNLEGTDFNKIPDVNLTLQNKIMKNSLEKILDDIEKILKARHSKD